MHKKLHGGNLKCSSEDMIADKHTHTHTHTVITVLRFHIGSEAEAAERIEK